MGHRFRVHRHHQAPCYLASLGFIFREFVKAAGDKPVESVTDVDFERYEKRLVGRELSATTVCSYMRQVSILFTFCLRKGWLKQDPRLRRSTSTSTTASCSSPSRTAPR